MIHKKIVVIGLLFINIMTFSIGVHGRRHGSGGVGFVGGMVGGMMGSIVGGALANSGKNSGPSQAEIEAHTVRMQTEQLQQQQVNMQTDQLRREMEQKERERMMMEHQLRRDSDKSMMYLLFGMFFLMMIGLAVWIVSRRHMG